MGQKFGGSVCPFRGSGSASNTMWPGPRPSSVPSSILIHPAVWLQQTWAENWGAVPLFVGAGFPSNTMWPETSLPPCQVSSWSIQLFGHNTPTSQTDRTDRQPGQTDRQRSDGIGQTVLQTIIQKLCFCCTMYTGLHEKKSSNREI